MGLFAKMKFWKKSSKASQNDCTNADTGATRRAAPAARGTALFHEFSSRIVDTSPAFDNRLALISALEERRAQSGGSGYIPVQYVSRPFPSVEARAWAAEADAHAASQALELSALDSIWTVDSFDLAEPDFEGVGDFQTRHGLTNRDLIACARQRFTNVSMDSCVSRSDGNLTGAEIEGQILPQAMNGTESPGLLDGSEMTDTIAPGTIMAGARAMDESTGECQSETVNSHCQDPGMMSWPTEDDVRENFDALPPIPITNNEEIMVSRDGSISGSEERNCSSMPETFAEPAYHDEEHFV